MIKFITLTNTGYVDYTLNCLESLKRIDFEFLPRCYCIGQKGFETLTGLGYDCVLIDDEKNSNFQIFRKGNWSNITYKKFLIIHENLLLHNYVCVTDGDIVYENKIFMDYLLEQIEDNDILIQDDKDPKCPKFNVCSGFMFIKSNIKTLELFNPKNVENDKDKKGWDDQVYLNKIIRKLKYKLLPQEFFPNGAYYYLNSKKINPYLIHFNYVIGKAKKDKMIKYNKWFVEKKDNRNKND